MSYSRWGSKGSGHWYTFWAFYSSLGPETRDNAIFEVFCTATFTAKDLRDNMDDCIKIVAMANKQATKKELKELRGYMGQFLHDVDKKYLPYIPIS